MSLALLIPGVRMRAVTAAVVTLVNERTVVAEGYVEIPEGASVTVRGRITYVSGTSVETVEGSSLTIERIR